MKRILAVTTINNTASLKEALMKIRDEHGDIVRIKKVYLEKYEDPSVPLDELEGDVEDADVVLVDIRGNERIGRELPGILDGMDKTVITLVWGSNHILSLTSMGRLNLRRLVELAPERIDSLVRSRDTREIMRIGGSDEIRDDLENWFRIMDYYGGGDPDNLMNMILFILDAYTDLEVPHDDPVEMPPYGLYLPFRGFYTDIESYRGASKFDPDLPTVGMLFYSGMHFDDTRPLVEELYSRLHGEVNCTVVFSDVENNLRTIEEYMGDVDLFINMQYFQLNGGPLGGDPEATRELLRRINAPYLICLRGYETDLDEWEGDLNGLNPMEVVLGVTLPELDGGFEPVFTAGMRTLDDPDLGEVRVVEVVPERMDKFAARIRNWLKLRSRENHEKRLAIIIYDYPPGEANLGSAGYLDVLESLEIFLKRLHENGYSVRIPEEPLKDIIMAEGLINSPSYLQCGGVRLPVDQYTEWFRGLPDELRDDVYARWGEPPGDVMVDGDDIIIPVVELGSVYLCIQPSRGLMDADGYHSRNMPPHHQYLAFYLYLQSLEPDAVVHFGMHGTLEFLPGKETALGDKCYPDLLIGDLPNIYLYWGGNTSESTIARRRSYALPISHASPPFMASDLYGEYQNLEELIGEWHEVGGEDLRERIELEASRLNITGDIGEIESEIFRMKRRLIPRGLHVIDTEWGTDDLAAYLLGVLRFEREYPSIHSMIAEGMGVNYSEVKDTAAGWKIEEKALDVLKDILLGRDVDLPPDYVEWVRGLSERCDFTGETESLLEALSGNYIPPGRGGDPVRDPETYPTGYAMYAFDPMKIPTSSAEARGRLSAELILRDHLERHGRYPETVAVVLWGFETLKTGGETISMILELLGVRINRRYGPWARNIEVIPLEELGRPRVDVLVNICGIFRDTLGNQIELLNRAFKEVANLDEDPEDNHILKHNLEDGPVKVPPRIFGPAPSEYASTLPEIIDDGSWNSEDELASTYLEEMCYAHLPGGVREAGDEFRRNLQRVEVVAQERDNVEYEVTDLDHYYEFMGGLTSSIRSLGGSCSVRVVDSTEDELYVEGLEDVIGRAVRCRVLNPRWLDGMLAHDYHGAKNIKDRVEHLLGFSATTGAVENWVYDDVAEKLILDDEMRRRITENNPFAAVRMGEILLETAERGYWDASEDRIERIRQMVLNIEYELE
ncbi:MULTISPECIES: cobaltochelatase subunit CobN [Methanothermobacter]|uniref:cobaltochelatase subunit CobN n=1 Tax=Methanothermobacter TaxID=145260 RepID=UPI0013666008|nr:cobaltochelatase subunit CobN [Methanothermobacter sp. THM-2]QHN07317.1 cobaltochelatase subunit CobN [Methanothermobacter sp. THM-2]